ncbi:hypothetical protein H0264_28905 [Nocardia huaxiensis]|uniref:Uncharacterized protein n=1 Tax=Nocardia huaxiensis TaxID=2755382 RepID=A0A7D6VGQ3_9NOCA|nr:hypothetical protein [Nocardia huaxiensis]QLY29270.1 hypothetical protein H0264_28905 [Nocardia huaxiensis]
MSDKHTRFWSSDTPHQASGRESAEVERNWAQLWQLFFQVMRQIERATADGSVRLTRGQRKELLAQAMEAQRQFAYETTNTQAWYQHRSHEYQQESHAAHTRARAGASAQEQAKATAYLSGLRASIEHTVHDTVLTPEQRGQVVQALGAVDSDPSKPLARNLFEPVSGREAVRARYAAAASEQRVVQHREELAATATGDAQPASGEIAQLRREHARRFDDLAGRLDKLEERLTELRPRETATANGHAPRAKHEARQRPRQHPAVQQDNGAKAYAEATVDADYGQPEPQYAEQAEHAEPRQQATAQAEQTAQMQAEA